MTDDILVYEKTNEHPHFSEWMLAWVLPPAPCFWDKSSLIANCAIPLVCINFSPTGYFSLLLGKHLSTWNYYCAKAPGEIQTAVNLVELW